MLKCKRCGDEQEELGIPELDKFCWCGGKLIKVKEAAQNQKPVSK
jgi:hypothetical protein